MVIWMQFESVDTAITDPVEKIQPDIDPEFDLRRVILCDTGLPMVGCCLECGAILTRGELSIEYDGIDGSKRVFVECRCCDAVRQL